MTRERIKKIAALSVGAAATIVGLGFGQAQAVVLLNADALSVTIPNPSAAQISDQFGALANPEVSLDAKAKVLTNFTEYKDAFAAWSDKFNNADPSFTYWITDMSESGTALTAVLNTSKSGIPGVHQTLKYTYDGSLWKLNIKDACGESTDTCNLPS